MARFPLERARALQLARWLMLGIGALGIELGLLWLLVSVVGLLLPIASALAAEALILGRFVVADRFVFGHRKPTIARLWRYHGACAGAFCLSWVVLNGTASLLEAPYILAALLGTGASFAWSLVTNFLWVWAQPSGARSHPV